MKKTAFLSDVFFAFFTCGVFTLCLFRYFKISLLLSLLLALLCGALCALSIGALLYNKRKNLLLKRSDELQKQKLLLHLVLLSDDKKIKFFEQIFSEQSPVKRYGKLRLYTPTELYFLRFSFSPVNADQIAALSHIKTNKEKILLCDEIEEKAIELCKSLHITVKTGAEVYLLVKNAKALPEVYLGDKTPVKPNERRKKLWFSKSNARRFLGGGALILLTSLFTPFSYYYWIFGSILILIAAFVRIFGYE